MSESIQEKQENILRQKIEEFIQTRDTRLKMERTIKILKDTEDQMEMNLWDMMEAWGFKSVQVENLGTITRTFKRIFNINDNSHYMEWCFQNNQQDLMRQEAHKRNLNSFCMDRIKEGNPDSLPPGVELIVDKIIQIRRERGEVEDE